MPSRNTSPLASAFTLVEVIIVTAIFSALLGLGLLLGMEVFRGTFFRSSREVLVSTLTTARTRALTNVHGSAHGVCYSAPDFVLFEGSTYSASKTSNERVTGSDSFSVSSSADFFTCGVGTGVVFQPLSGKTAGGDITVSSTGHADETVRVNSAGTILW